ncbi:hypothetical protein ABB02_02065 [Clostridiaceae bacterium JG1575]|nr:hypothetical protein ABB02_02065 [Clostridiaceae bacterium JG1575]
MDSKELMERIDQVRSRVKVSHKEALGALKEHQYDVLDAVIALEEGHRKERVDQVRRTVSKVTAPTISLQRHGHSLIRVPAMAFGAGVFVAALWKPKALAIGTAVLALSSVDLAYEKGNGETVSVARLLKHRTAGAIRTVQETREDLETRFQDMKDAGYLKDQHDAGEKYFTISL